MLYGPSVIDIGVRASAGTAALAALVALTSACGGSSGPAAAASRPASPTAAVQQPRTEAQVRTIAQQEYDAYSAGRWDQAWDLWTTEGKAAFSQADYLKLRHTCPPTPGTAFAISAVLVNGDHASVRTEHGGAVFSSDFVYQDGQWRYQPPAANMADYRAGVDKAIAKEKAAGTC